ncbi:MAG: hypothetical protein H6508_00290 [Calditrichaeota bacterium]|nr:hypothetical protein [Calditrichota bacterium]MCB9365611.1 hypothetical protein [Calditrichota bacterium]
MTSKKLCPHCLKIIPLKHRFKRRCPHCFRPLRQHSENERTLLGTWFEDRGKWWWFFILLVIFVVGAMVAQMAGRHSSLLNFISGHPILFAITLYYLASFFSIISRIYFPLMIGAPRILRRERAQVRSYKTFTAAGVVLGLILSISVVGPRNYFVMLPASAVLFTIPIALLWAYLALVLQEPDYEDERVWSYLTELGAADRLDHRQAGYYVLIMVPIAALIFYWMMQNLWLYHWFADSLFVDMFRELYMRATGRWE